jgi:hypothetical protein
MKIEAKCIKSYQDEDDLEEYRKGKIEHEHIKTYKEGEVQMVVRETFNKDYWEPVKY